jgi:hypothetical protein
MSKPPTMSPTGRRSGPSILRTLIGKRISGPFVITLAILAIYSAGCATRDADASAPKPGQGIVEYRRIAVDSLKAVDRALKSLDSVAAQTSSCPPRVLAAFSRELDKLQVESMQLRARSKAMQARGDAYFANWEEHLAQVKDPRRRVLAEQHHTELQQNFGSIKLNSQKVSDAFKPFSAGLRKLQSSLENDPTTVSALSNRELVRNTRQYGQQVRQGITAIKDELDAMTALLTPSKNTPKS